MYKGVSIHVGYTTLRFKKIYLKDKARDLEVEKKRAVLQLLER